MAKKANVDLYSNFIKSGDALNKQYEAYEAQYVHRAHDELYVFLAEVMQYVTDILNMEDSEAILRAVRRQLKDVYNIKTTAKTDDIGVLLRLVLRNAHRKTIFTYKRAIQQAIDNKITAAEFAEYIKSNGGVEKLRTGEAERAAAAMYKQEVNDKEIMAAYYLLACDEQRRMKTIDIDFAMHTRCCDTKNNDGIVFVACSYDTGKLNLLEFMAMDEELNTKLLLKLYKEKFELKAYAKDRERLVKRAYELNEMQAVMLGDKIYSNGKAVEDIKVEEFVT